VNGPEEFDKDEGLNLNHCLTSRIL